MKELVDHCQAPSASLPCSAGARHLSLRTCSLADRQAHIAVPNPLAVAHYHFPNVA